MRILLKSLIWLIITPALASEPLSLLQVIELAERQSLDAIRARNLFLANYWDFQSYKSRQLPHLDWYINPVTYNRRMTMRYDFENNVDVYREQQTLSSYSVLGLRQNIVATGASVSLESDLYRLQNFNETNLNSWSTTPVRVSLNQPLWGFNRFAWEKKISPLKYEKSRQEYVQAILQTKKKAVILFFDLLLACIKHDIAKGNIQNADTLYNVGLKKFAIAAIAREELLDLELSKHNASLNLSQTQKMLDRARFNLTSFLGFENAIEIQPLIPEELPVGSIDASLALDYAGKNNPLILSLRQMELESDRELQKAVKESRLNASLNLSYGLNQTANTLNLAYQDPPDQQMVVLGLHIPIVDWGDSRGRMKMAQSRKEVVLTEVKQALLDFEQQVNLRVIDFNLQDSYVENARRAAEIAEESHSLTIQRFLLGRADVLRVTNATRNRQTAKENYINGLATYWRYYYDVMEVTLFDFAKSVSLEADFEKLINQ